MTEPSVSLTISEPLCCGQPMVHNSWTGEYECADAYFALEDEGYGEGVIEQLRPADLPEDLVPVLAHWRESRRPDGSDGAL